MQFSGMAVALLWAGAALAPVTAAARQVVVDNGSQLVTTSGQQIDAHGGGVLKVGGYYYLIGENRNPDYSFRAVSMYRSTDLKSWEFVNDILRSSSDPELNGANIERPKLLYNEKTHKFVLWAHKENGRDYTEARVAVATSDSIGGNYTYHGSFRPLEYDSRDMTVFKDTDGTAYLISAADVNYDLNIYRLSDDYTRIDSLVTILKGFHREAPAIMKRAGVYFLLTSGASGWTPNQAAYFTATSLAGPWSGPTRFGHPVTYNSQSTFILPVEGSAGTSYMYMGDRWGPAIGQIVNESTYVWMPITFPTRTSMDMLPGSQITIDAARGTLRPGAAATRLVTMKAAHSSLCMKIEGFYHGYNGGALQWGCQKEDNGMVERRPIGNYVQYVVQHSGLCLAQQDDRTAGARVIQTSCSIGPRSQWTYNGSTIVNRASGSCMDVMGASLERDAPIVTWTCNGGANQRWTFEEL